MLSARIRAETRLLTAASFPRSGRRINGRRRAPAVAGLRKRTGRAPSRTTGRLAGASRPTARHGIGTPTRSRVCQMPDVAALDDLGRRAGVCSRQGSWAGGAPDGGGLASAAFARHGRPAATRRAGPGPEHGKPDRRGPMPAARSAGPRRRSSAAHRNFGDVGGSRRGVPAAPLSLKAGRLAAVSRGGPRRPPPATPPLMRRRARPAGIRSRRRAWPPLGSQSRRD